MSRPRIVLDCDPGLDDAFAILTAARYARLEAITTVSGNVGIDKTTHNALIITQIAGLDVPVHRGAGRPLIVEPEDASEVHGDSGLGGPELPELTRRVASNDGVGALIDATADGEVTVVAIGPLTNVAMAINRDPDWARRIPEIVLMGGSTSFGNVTATAEFNIWADPHAAEIVFGSGASIRMVGLNLTHQVLMGAAEEKRLRLLGSRTAKFGADLLEFYGDFSEQHYGVRRGAMHDPCAVLAVTHPDLIGFVDRHVTIETTGTHTFGMTIVDERVSAPEPNASVAMTVDGAEAVDLIVAAVADPKALG